MRRRRSQVFASPPGAAALACLVAATALVGVPGAARAQAVPAAIPFQGTLVEAGGGAPVEGDRVLRVGLYAGADGGDPLFEEDVSITLVGGVFTAYLGVAEPLDLALFRTGTLWVELEVLDDPVSGDQGEAFPRFPFGSVPYAAVSAFAYECATLDGLAAGDLAPAMHRHAWSELDGVPASVVDGVSGGEGVTVEGGVVDLDTTVFQRRVIGSCAQGLAMRAIAEDGTVTCEPISGGTGTYAAGDGIDITGSVISVAANEVTAAMHAWGPPLTLPFAPTAESGDCRDEANLGGDVWGSTSSRSFRYVGALGYDESRSDEGLDHDYRRARLRVMCRGNGWVELVTGCSSVATVSIRCRNTDRPKTLVSSEFSVGSSGEYDVRVRAIAGDLDWAHPALIVY